MLLYCMSVCEVWDRASVRDSCESSSISTKSAARDQRGRGATPAGASNRIQTVPSTGISGVIGLLYYYTIILLFFSTRRIPANACCSAYRATLFRTTARKLLAKRAPTTGKTHKKKKNRLTKTRQSATNATQRQSCYDTVMTRVSRIEENIIIKYHRASY